MILVLSGLAHPGGYTLTALFVNLSDYAHSFQVQFPYFPADQDFFEPEYFQMQGRASDEIIAFSLLIHSLPQRSARGSRQTERFHKCLK